MTIATAEVDIHVFQYNGELYAVTENPGRISEREFGIDEWWTDLCKVQSIHDQLNNGALYPDFPEYNTLTVKIVVRDDF